jgi:phosphoglycerate dehydrogenase-like enzyme
LQNDVFALRKTPMGKIKILWSWVAAPIIHNYFSADLFSLETLGWITPPSEEEAIQNEQLMLEKVSQVDFIVSRKRFRTTKNVISSASNLKLIYKLGRYPEDTIDMEAAKAEGIPVATLPMALDMAVAEHAIMFMLALSKNLIASHLSVVNGDYEKFGLSPAETCEIAGHTENWPCIPVNTVYHRTIGIIGMGEIGSAIAERANALGMKILYYRRRRLIESLERKLNSSYSSMSDLLRKADYVVLAVPHTAQTHRMIDEEALSMMKASSYLINICRGGVVHEKALYKALKEKRIAGAALDVFEQEPTPKTNPLLQLPNVIFTPHTAANWPDGWNVSYDYQRVAEDLLLYAKESKLVHADFVSE